MTEELRNHPLHHRGPRRGDGAAGGASGGGLRAADLRRSGGHACSALLGDGQQTTLHFFDAAAPLVSFDSVDMDSAYFASRYDKGTPDYINCPLAKEEYLAFWQELTTAQEAEVHGFEDRQRL